jgi:hypothetical protein
MPVAGPARSFAVASGSADRGLRDVDVADECPSDRIAERDDETVDVVASHQAAHLPESRVGRAGHDRVVHRIADASVLDAWDAVAAGLLHRAVLLFVFSVETKASTPPASPYLRG